MSKLLGFAAVVFLSSVSLAQEADEIAPFGVDTDRSRTSRSIIDGSVETEILMDQQCSLAGDGYPLMITYDLRIRFLGWRQGVVYVDVSASFFEEDFFEDLREAGEIHLDQFSVEHLGYSSVTNMDGVSYPDTDVIRVYNIAQCTPTWTEALLTPPSMMNFEDLELVAHIYPGIPVLGAVKLDMSGVYSGRSLKIGGDYQSP